MTTLDPTINVSNVYLYISDALRWSATPDTIMNMGATFKTVSAGCATMRSVSSILTGLNAPHHGVKSWTDQLTEPTLFDIDGINTGFFNPAAGGKGGLSSVLERESEETLNNIKPPFVYVERDGGGHAPYLDLSYEEMLSQLEHTQSNLRSHYSAEVDASIERFEQRLETLSDRGLLNDTLVVFLGDHGELLGEHGLVSHTSPPTPELVYTPTTFIHPEFSGGQRSETIGHIDIVPTTLAAIGESLDRQQFDGVDLFKSTPGPRYNDAVHTRTFSDFEVKLYHASGLWDGDGGHVFTKRGKPLGIIIGLLKANGWNRKYWKNNPVEISTALWYYFSPHRKHGSPKFSKSRALDEVTEIQNKVGTAKSVEVEDEVQERLEELGYRT